MQVAIRTNNECSIRSGAMKINFTPNRFGGIRVKMNASGDLCIVDFDRSEIAKIVACAIQDDRIREMVDLQKGEKGKK